MGRAPHPIPNFVSIINQQTQAYIQ